MRYSGWLNASDEALFSLRAHAIDALIQAENNQNLIVLAKNTNPLDRFRQATVTTYVGHVHALDQFVKTGNWLALDCCNVLSQSLVEVYLRNRKLSPKYRATHYYGDRIDKSEKLMKERGYKEVVQRLRAFAKRRIDSMIKLPSYVKR